MAKYDLKAKRWPVASETRMVGTSYGPTFVRISGSPGAGHDLTPVRTEMVNNKTLAFLLES